MALLIRPASEADVEAMLPLVAELGYPATASVLAERLNCTLGDPTQLVALAADGEEVVGFIHAAATKSLVNASYANIQGLVVAPGHRGKGIGRKLIDEAGRWGLALGLSRIRLGSRIHRSEAHAFYEHLGFRLTKEHRIYERPLAP